VVDRGPGHPVLASHRAFPADLAGHVPPQFLGQARAVQHFELVFPRVELHLFYNAVVFIPMVIGMYYHVFPPESEEGRWPAHANGATSLQCKPPDSRSSDQDSEHGDSRDGIRLSTEPAPGAPASNECRNLLLCACAATLFMTACSRPPDSSRTVTIEPKSHPSQPGSAPSCHSPFGDHAAKAVTERISRLRQTCRTRAWLPS